MGLVVSHVSAGTDGTGGGGGAGSTVSVSGATVTVTGCNLNLDGGNGGECDGSVGLGGAASHDGSFTVSGGVKIGTETINNEIQHDGQPGTTHACPYPPGDNDPSATCDSQ